jgi:hypothetical protein
VIRLLIYLVVWIFQEYRTQKHVEESRVRKRKMDRLRDDLDYFRDGGRQENGGRERRARRADDDEENDDARPRFGSGRGRDDDETVSPGKPLLKALLIVGSSVAAGAFLIGGCVVGMVLLSPLRNRSPGPSHAVAGPQPPFVQPAGGGPDGSPPGQPPLARRPGQRLTIQTAGRQVVHTRFAPNGKSVATLGGNSVCQLWDRATGKELGTFGGERPDYVNWLTYSPDGGFLVAYDGGSKIVLRDGTTGDVKGQIDPGGVDAYNGGSFSPDGAFFVLAGGGSIRFWDVPAGSPLKRFKHVQPTPQANYGSALITPDGKTLITGARTANGRLDQVWDLTGQTPVRQLTGLDRKNIWSRLELSPDGKLVMVQTTAQIEVLDWQKDKRALTINVPPGTEAFAGAAFTPDATARRPHHATEEVSRHAEPRGT